MVILLQISGSGSNGRNRYLYIPWSFRTEALSLDVITRTLLRPTITTCVSLPTNESKAVVTIDKDVAAWFWQEIGFHLDKCYMMKHV